MNEDDRFANAVIFDTGVVWNPTDYRSMDQTPYLKYLDKHEDKVRAFQAGVGRDDDYSPAAMERDETMEDEL